MSFSQIKMTSAEIKMRLESKTEEMKAACADLSKWHLERSNNIATTYSREMYELHVQLRHAEAEEAMVAEDYEDDEGWNVGLERRQEQCYHCGHTVDACMCEQQEEQAEDDACSCESDGCICNSQLNPEAKIFEPASAPVDAIFDSPPREGTKLKWISTNPETYSVAIITKKGILEVKRVTNGEGYCHDRTVCQCRPCSEIRLSIRLGAPPPPWLSGTRAPLVKTLFATEEAWRASLPQGGMRGSITTTVPSISKQKLNKLYSPLSGTTDGLKLQELEKRCPGATILLNTVNGQFEIEHTFFDIASYPVEWCHQIYCRKLEKAVMRFSDLGASTHSNGKPYIIVEWKGLIVDLSCLF